MARPTAQEAYDAAMNEPVEQLLIFLGEVTLHGKPIEVCPWQRGFSNKEAGICINFD